MDVSSYLGQHKQIVSLALEINDFVTAGNVAENSEKIRSTLSDLAGKLSVHLAVEDKNIYPRCADCDSEELKNLAANLGNEMQGIAAAFTEFVGKYAVAGTVAEKADDFSKDFSAILGVLDKRVKFEEEQFYPLVEKHL